MRRPSLVAAVVGVLVGLSCVASALRAQPSLQRGLPQAEAFRTALLEVVAEYPTDGTHRFHWPKSGGWAGVTQDLHYGGKLVAGGDPQGRCYCCGLTYEVFLRAYERCCEQAGSPFAIPGQPDAKALKLLRKAWFGADGNRRTMQNAIVQAGLGRVVEDLTDARAGDFVQLWRHSGSGHAVVFLRWVWSEGAIVGLRYWSTQKSTKGIGERVEMFGSGDGGDIGRKGVDRAQLYIARVGRPEAAFRLQVGAPRGGAEPDVLVLPGRSKREKSEAYAWSVAKKGAVGALTARYRVLASGTLGPKVEGQWLELSETEDRRRWDGDGGVVLCVLYSPARLRVGDCAVLAERIRSFGRRPVVLVGLGSRMAGAVQEALAAETGLVCIAGRKKAPKLIMAPRALAWMVEVLPED